MVTRWVRPLAAVLLGFSLLFQNPVVSADAVPYPATISHHGNFPVGVRFRCAFRLAFARVSIWPRNAGRGMPCSGGGASIDRAHTASGRPI